MERLEDGELIARRLTSRVEHATVALTSPAAGPKVASRIGTGFFVAPSLVATCAHVVGDSSTQLPATVSAEEPSTGRSTALDADAELYFRELRSLDLALLTVSARRQAAGAEDWPVPSRYVLLNPDLRVGDELWTYGYPQGSFRAGQPATFQFEGWSRHSAAPEVELPRLRGTPVREGASGSPVLNLRTGAVCGMLALSNKAGSAHLVSAQEILDCCPDARRLYEAHGTAHREWLSCLSDEQLVEGGWSFPGVALRTYLKAAERACERHPYRELILPTPGRPARRMPALSTVYVHQSAASGVDEFTGDKSETDPVSASVIFDQQDDCVLVGSAGAGKSSILRTATMESIRRWNRDADRAVLVRVEADALLAEKPLPEIIAASVNAELSNVGTDRQWSTDFFRRAPLPNVVWLVLVDGLDEIVDARQRQEVVDKIWGFRQGPGRTSHRFVIATRPLADIGLVFAEEWPLKSYRLLPFSDAQFKDFALRWLDFLGVDNPGAAADRLLLLLLDSGRDRLFRIPLVAMMMCQLHAGDPYSPIPSTGIETYRRFVDLLGDRFFQSGIRDDLTKLASPYGTPALSAVDTLVVECGRLVRALAWLHREEPQTSLTHAAFQKTSSLRPDQLPPATWTQFLQGVLRRTGLLLEDADDFDFLHESVAEFLAAEHVSMDADLSTAKFGELLPDRRGD